jgi:hypothetical protein
MPTKIVDHLDEMVVLGDLEEPGRLRAKVTDVRSSGHDELERLSG